MNDPINTSGIAQCYSGNVPSGVPVVQNTVNGVETTQTPAHFVPVASIIPGNLDDLINHGFLGETTAWAGGQYVVLGDGSRAHWDGAEWQPGQADE